MVKTKEWLIAARKKEGLTQKQLAEKIGVSIYAIAHIEQGQRVGSVETWEKINNFFEDVNISYDCEEIIEEIKEEIEEFGEDQVCYLYYELKGDTIVFTDYGLPEDLLRKEFKLKDNEFRLEGTLKQALEIFCFQNKII